MNNTKLESFVIFRLRSNFIFYIGGTIEYELSPSKKLYFQFLLMRCFCQNWFEITEAGTIYSPESCTRPTRCIPVALGLRGHNQGLSPEPKPKTTFHITVYDEMATTFTSSYSLKTQSNPGYNY